MFGDTDKCIQDLRIELINYRSDINVVNARVNKLISENSALKVEVDILRLYLERHIGQHIPTEADIKNEREVLRLETELKHLKSKMR